MTVQDLKLLVTNPERSQPVLRPLFCFFIPHLALYTTTSGDIFGSCFDS